MHYHKDDWSEFGSIINSCKDVLISNQMFKVCYIKRQANKVADALAKAACSYINASGWFTPPSTIVSLFDEDVIFELSNNK